MSLSHHKQIKAAAFVDQDRYCLVLSDLQCPLMKRYTSLMKGDNTYLGLQSLQPWSVYGDSNSFLMLNMREEKDCQKVAPFLQNLPTFKKRTHYFWYSKVTGAFPGGLWAQVLLSISLVQVFCMPNPKILSKLVNSAQNEKEIKYQNLQWKFIIQKLTYLGLY